MASSRSEFLKQAAGAAAVVAGASAGAGALASPAKAALFNPKEYLMLDGVNVGRLVSASGSDPEFDVVIADFDAGGNPNKLLGRSKWSNIVLRVGAGMGKGMYDWISASMTDPSGRKDGARIPGH